MTFRNSEDDPVWQEVAKRYQEILEREDKLLRTYPSPHGQMIPLAKLTPPSVKALPTPGGDTNNKEQRCEEVGKKRREPSRWLTKNQTYVKCIVIEEERLDNGVTADMSHKSLPKILEVYSLNSSKIQGEETKTRKRKNAQDLSSSINEESSKDATQDATDAAHTLRTWKKPCVVLDNFIDLTSDDDEESITCSSDNKVVGQTRNVNVSKCESEGERSKEGASDKRIDPQSRKCDRNKRERGFVQEGNQGKRSCPTQQRDQNDSKNPIDEGCDKSEIITIKNNNNKYNDANNNYNNSNTHKNKNSCENESLRDEDNGNRGKTMKKTLNEEKRNWKCGNLSSGNNNALDMSYRDNKITDLKARLAKQEEELAKLRTFKEWKPVMDERQQATLNHSTVEKPEQKENTKIELDNLKKETTVGTVNLEDICQHVIKSFGIFNARKRKDITVGKEGVSDFQVRENNACDVSNGIVGKQEEFLFQVGLRRKFPNHK